MDSAGEKYGCNHLVFIFSCCWDRDARRRRSIRRTRANLRSRRARGPPREPRFRSIAFQETTRDTLAGRDRVERDPACRDVECACRSPVQRDVGARRWSLATLSACNRVEAGTLGLWESAELAVAR